jgi:hypothetical protein
MMNAEAKTSQDTLLRAIQWQIDSSHQEKPSSPDIATALRQTERSNKRVQQTGAYAKLLGTWQLLFITKSKSLTGQWIPSWLKIQITYTHNPTSSAELSVAKTSRFLGEVHNQVRFGALKLTLSGPTAFNSANGILAFDFTRFDLAIGDQSLFSGAIRGGATREAEFYEIPLKQQAFFRFFWITPQGIAARGKGGGLALWSKNNADQAS